jgi:TonB family protein
VQRARFRTDLFALGAAISLVLHIFVVLPFVILPLIEPLLAKHDAPIEVAYLPDPAEGEDKAAPDETPPEAPKLDAVPDKKDKEKKLAEKPPEPAKVEPPKPPEPAKVEPPKPQVVQAKPVPPPPPVPLQRMKMVDQDRAEEEPDNAEARYLAQKNHKAAEDSRTLDTNLVRNSKGAAASAESQNQDPNVGEKETKIAELEERKGVENKIVRGRPLAGDEGMAKRAPKDQKPDKLAMRDLKPKAAVPVPEVKPREGLELPEEGVGPLPRARVGEGERQQAARKGGQRYKLDLDAHDYDRIEGESVAEKERHDAARAERSHAKGRWDRVQQKMAMVRSSLENFTPEVKVGNQAELGTRAHPFAAYIAEMHRSIHKLWAFGFLTELDGKGASSPYNDMDLWTQLEIVLKGDGTVEKVTIVRGSGYAPFDVAAMDAVMSSSPFSTPPDAIKSVNGKVYLDWRFHRDDRQCGTFGVDPHILTAVGDNQTHDTSEVAKTPRVAPPRVLQRGPSAAQSAPLVTAPSGGAPARAASAADATVPDGAKDAAQGWFAAYVRGDAGWLAGWSATPLSAAGEVAAKDSVALKKLYGDLLREAPADRHLSGFDVYTAGGVRAKLGGLPPGGEGDGSMMFAVGELKGEHFVLLLKKSDQGWRVCGIDR